jgi:hypothetical protein
MPAIRASVIRKGRGLPNQTCLFRQGESTWWTVAGQQPQARFPDHRKYVLSRSTIGLSMAAFRTYPSFKPVRHGDFPREQPFRMTPARRGECEERSKRLVSSRTQLGQRPSILLLEPATCEHSQRFSSRPEMAASDRMHTHACSPNLRIASMSQAPLKLPRYCTGVTFSRR